MFLFLLFVVGRLVTGVASLASRQQVVSVPTLPGTWGYAGCLEDNGFVGEPTFIGPSYTNTSGMTVQQCVGFCNSQSFVFSGLESGCTCFCDNFYEHVLESVGNNECDMHCVGNFSQFCGGENRLSVYRDFGVNPLIPQAVPSAGLWESLGCFNDSTDARALERPVSAGNVTVESCTSVCLAEGFPLAGLEFGQECWCGSELHSNSIHSGDFDGIDEGDFRPDPGDDLCNMGCAGNASELCGGSNRLNLYNYTGNFPTGASVVPFSGAWISQGCVSDSTTLRTLERRVDAGNVTVEACTAACQFSAFTIAGLEFGQECWCGDEIRDPGQPIAQSACNLACVGDSTEDCGGPDALQTYGFQDSPQVIGDIQELIGLSDSLAGFLAGISATNVQTTGPDMLVGMQGIINTVGMTTSNASTATDGGQSPFISNNAVMIVNKLEQYVPFAQELANALLGATGALEPTFGSSVLQAIINMSDAFDNMTQSFAEDFIPSMSSQILSMQTSLDRVFEQAIAAY